MTTVVGVVDTTVVAAAINAGLVRSVLTIPAWIVEGTDATCRVLSVAGVAPFVTSVTGSACVEGIAALVRSTTIIPGWIVGGTAANCNVAAPAAVIPLVTNVTACDD